MGDFGILESAAERLQGGDIPETRDTLSDALVLVLKELLQHFMAVKSPLSDELDNFLNLARKGEDPLLLDLDRIQRTMVFSVVNTLIKTKEQMNARADEEATRDNHAANDNPST